MSARKGSEFEDMIADLLHGYFEIEETNVKLKGEEVGKRREFDIIASKDIHPLGKIYFLIECKDHKSGVAKSDIETYNKKLEDVRGRRETEYAMGTPVIISRNDFQPGAIDSAKKYGITCLTLDDIISHEIPTPTSVGMYLNALYHLSLAQKSIGNVKYYLFGYQIIEVMQNVKLKKLEREIDVEIDFQQVKGLIPGLKTKTNICLYALFVGRVNSETYLKIIKQFEDTIEIDKETSKRREETLRILGFVVDKAPPEDIKLFGKIRPKELNICLISTSESTEKIYGSKEAQDFFRLKSYIEKTTVQIIQ